MKDKENQIFDKYGNYNFPTDIKQDSPNIATSQIEEIQHTVENYFEARLIIGSYDLARKLYKIAVPEDSVVLPKEEYEHLKAKSTRIPIDKDGNFIEYAVYDTDRVLSKPEYRNYIYEKGSKETAEKCIRLIKEKTYFTKEALCEYIARQFGVDIKG